MLKNVFALSAMKYIFKDKNVKKCDCNENCHLGMGVHHQLGAPVAQWVKRWPTDLADRVRSSPEVKSSQP